MLAIEQILNEISPMQPLEKIKLVDKILNSLELPNKEINKIWQEEAEKRIKAYDKGEISSISAKNLFKKYNR